MTDDRNRRNAYQCIAPPTDDEASHFVRCAVCGQAFDCRRLGGVMHHEEPGICRWRFISSLDKETVMSERNIFDTMAKSRGEALTAGQHPLCWSMNRAALHALAMDERIANQHSSVPLEERPFMGIPIKVDEDRSEKWRFTLSLQPTK